VTLSKKTPSGRRASGHVSHILFFTMPVAGVILMFATAPSRAQSNLVSHANDFTSVEYYPAPNQQQMKSRLSGTEAQPLTGGLLAIKQLKLEMFKPDGELEITVNAPECVYNQLDGTASSPGRLEVQTGDDKILVEGEGFLWRQNDSFLTISNQVRTVIKTVAKQSNQS
jgi:hypothetical protein